MSQTERRKNRIASDTFLYYIKDDDCTYKINRDIISEYHHYMRDIGASERHQNNALKAVIGYAKFLGENTAFDESSNIDVRFLWITR
jgi:hypothetical protein